MQYFVPIVFTSNSNLAEINFAILGFGIDKNKAAIQGVTLVELSACWTRYLVVSILAHYILTATSVATQVPNCIGPNWRPFS